VRRRRPQPSPAGTVATSCSPKATIATRRRCATRCRSPLGRQARMDRRAPAGLWHPPGFWRTIPGPETPAVR
jgi:hypothetical protein